ncbi:Kinesin-like protein kif18b [Saguinus oedipus]|uniref:Kinesin-like protein kif18b n=1 Tax=Saguinus oedipus TaxID=9490 RepID=A0ABQ9VF44_SAGOE|nr:Kinesin-like protein kif18b [Saguinus oedipus]
MEKKRRRPCPLEPDSPMALKRGTKCQRQSFLPCLRRGSLPDAQPSLGPSTPKGQRASSFCPSPHFCPATVIKSQVPLGPSAMQNCSTPLALPTRDLNATFDLSEEPPSKPSFHECIGWDRVPQELNRLHQPFIPRGPMLLFTTKGPKPMFSLPGTSACKKRHVVRSSISWGSSRIAHLPSSTLKRPAGPLELPELPLSPWCPSNQRERTSSGWGECCQRGTVSPRCPDHQDVLNPPAPVCWTPLLDLETPAPGAQTCFPYLGAVSTNTPSLYYHPSAAICPATHPC